MATKEQYGSILNNLDKTSSIESILTSVQPGEKLAVGLIDQYKKLETTLDNQLAGHLDASTRLIGAPHQFLAHNDHRFGKSSLGRNYAERIIMNAPIVNIKPGVPEFLPGTNSKEKEAFNSFLSDFYHGGDKEDIRSKLNSAYGEDVIQYYGIKDDFSGYMNQVNTLCRLLATMLGINKLKVPWANSKKITFGNYDWRQYRMGATLGDLSAIPDGSGNVFSAFSDFLGNAGNRLMDDFEFIKFYITPDSSSSQSFSNSTSSSVLDNLTSQLEGAAKELQVISSMSGADISGLAEGATGSLEQYLTKHDGGGAIGDVIRRVTGAAKQVINGGNFILPEIWSDSSADSNYSFSVHLVTPYGNKLAWYLNVGVPMMYWLALVLPVQQTANVMSSPYLIKANSPGWFNTSFAIVDSLAFEKASDGTWNMANLPNDVTIRVSVKDLYSAMSLPKGTSPAEFFANTGLTEFLMVTAGVDISRQDIGDKWKIWTALMKNSMNSLVQKTTYDAMMAFKHHASGIFKILK